MLLSPIVFMGDSITVGMGPYLHEGLNRLGVRHAVYAKTGSNARQWLENGWVEDALDRSRARMAVVALGTNPSGNGQAYARQMASIVGICSARGVPVFVVSPFAEDDDGEYREALLSEYPPPMGIDGYALAEGLPRDGVGDIHFTPEGYEALARRLVAYVASSRFGRSREGRSIVPGAIGVLAATLAVLTMPWWLGR